MQPTTLRDAFPKRAVPHGRNFIRENVLRIKTFHQPDVLKSDPTAQVSHKIPSTSSLSKLHVQNANSGNPGKPLKQVRRPGIQKVEIRPVEKRSQHISDLIVINNITHRSMQTNHQNDDNIEGVVMYANHPQQSGPGMNKKMDATLAMTPPLSKTPPIANSEVDVHLNQQVNYIRSNIMALKAGRGPKKGAPNTESPNEAPAHYKRGVPPKYIKQTDVPVNQPSECPRGHVLLPEDDRKETLRVLRESYAEKIQELNCMPVRSDTLRMQRRKVELESELMKIEEGIKIFQRTNVFVKVDI